ncbi:MAG: HAD-IB family phosphatase [Thermoproteus sp. AZ2]|uniref:HAD-IB family phosphatase n=1 Tax=Thermoproteus sp. AZ2 TaxID=1609232 RepID=A0ACC6V2S9_9CREN|nr:MAG: phosphoserine phosphatase [Thermoproteus sp. AZ2]
MRPRAVALDVDGVLTYFKSAWQRLHKILGVNAEINRALYYAGYIDYVEWAIADVELWRGVPRHMAEARFTPRHGFDELCSTLAKMGALRIAISAGVGYTRQLSKCFDEFLVNDLIYRGNAVDGVEVVVTNTNKGDVLRSVLSKYGISPDEAIAVGDSETDIPLFRIAGFSIAFNPTSEAVARAANVVIRSHSLTPLAKYLRAITANS